MTAPVVVRERPIVFRGAMVRAILAGTKTQTRRVIRLPGYVIGERDDGTPWPYYAAHAAGDEHSPWAPCPYGVTGDRLWVRETLERGNLVTGAVERTDGVYYRADGEVVAPEAVWVWWQRDTLPAWFCPRWASRITLEITGVRVERVQDISEADARAEGVPEAASVGKFRQLWDAIHTGPNWWDGNPWVWVLEFRRLTP
ncbi:MAG TPA: hypothetical protein VFQ22_07935 [Longimicrobiales bacterium]|nr:hypothetical protein [Longimicrobiales bacterium]